MLWGGRRVISSRFPAHNVPISVVVGVQAVAVLVLGIARQMPVGGIDHLDARAIRRARVKMLIPAARLQVAKVCRMS